MQKSKPFSLLAVGHHLWPEAFQERGEIRTFLALRERLGGECHVIVVGAQPMLVTRSVDGLAVTQIPQSRGRVGFLWGAVRIASRVVQSSRLANATLASDPLGGVVGLILRSRTGVPVVAEVQGSLLFPGTEFGPWWRRFVISRISRTVARRADGVRCVNSVIDAQVRSLRPRGVVETIGTRVDTEEFAPSPRTNESNAAATITSVASLHPRKNLAMLLKAFASLSESYPDARIVLVGEGPQRKTLEQLAEQLGISQKVELVGAVPRNRVVQILQGSTVFALPSLSEGQPRALLEAQSVGLPVVVSRIPGTESVRHGETGLLVNPTRMEEWVRALKMLLDDGSLRRRLGDSARQLVVKNHAFEENINRFAEFITRVVSRRIEQQ